MGVELKKIYSNVAKNKETKKRSVYVKVSSNGAVLGINGNKEKVELPAKNLYASQHDIIDYTKLDSTDLSKYHLIILGSHNKKEPNLDKLKKYIEDGGYLLATGASLNSIVADLFPNMLSFDKKEIKGGFFKGEVKSLEHPYFTGATKKKAMKFWIEDKSHPVKKVGPDVKELVTSKKLEKKYGSGTIVVTFNYGNGIVIYMMPKLHNQKSGEQPNYASAHILSNILDEAVNKAIPDVLRKASDMGQVAYVNMAVLDDPSKKCAFCGSPFKDYDGKVYKCGSCDTHYHQFCLDQQLSAEGTCKNCGKLMIYEKFKQTVVQAPWQQQAPQTGPQPETQGQGPPPPPPR
ncbi:MAG: hypothetical protein JSW28_03285 [Thermoplasmata archaeon]|nr:MAG: hypothetical protein JSW28_03285 [Thermoplasmata archaeon]